MLGPTIWPPFATEELEYKAIPAHCNPRFATSAARILSSIQGHVIYALKPLATSYGLALLARFTRRLPLVLDVDDWELGFVRWRLRRSFKTWWRFHDPNWVGWTWLLDKLVHLADEITVSNQFLARRYGGHLVPHGRDVSFLDPSKYEGAAIKAALGLAQERLILFLGTARPHKGLEDLVAAVRMIPDKRIKILLVGAQSPDPFVDSLKAQAGDLLHVVGMRPLSERAQWLAAADIVVLPQRASTATIGQTPAKLFDAMAMAKPIIATAVSDIPAILDGCGIVVPPGDIKALADQICHLLDNFQEATRLGSEARRKCVQNYSWQTMERTLLQVFSKYESSSR